jgi:hypothetical protein
MKKLNSLSNAVIIVILSAFILSCKKEPAVNKTIDLTDANIRITRVEQLYPLKTPPFAGDGVYASDYISSNNDSIFVNMSRGLVSPSEIRPPILCTKENDNLYNLKFKGLSFFAFGNASCGIDKSHISINNGQIQKITDELNSAITLCFVDRVRVASFHYQAKKISTIKVNIDCPLPSECNDDYIICEYDRTEWSGNSLVKYDYYSFHEVLFDYQNPANSIFGKDIGVGKELTIEMQYNENNSFIPKMLLTKVNQLLSGILAGSLDDFIHSWQVDFITENNTFMYPYLSEGTQSLMRDLDRTRSKKILGDWIWSFAHPSFNVLPEQDKIISSKRMVGKKMVDIVDGEPVYQAVDSTATFPYTHDPVAKTLEIAGLKIWYEVVE